MSMWKEVLKPKYGDMTCEANDWAQMQMTYLDYQHFGTIELELY